MPDKTWDVLGDLPSDASATSSDEDDDGDRGDGSRGGSRGAGTPRPSRDGCGRSRTRTSCGGATAASWRRWTRTREGGGGRGTFSSAAAKDDEGEGDQREGRDEREGSVLRVRIFDSDANYGDIPKRLRQLGRCADASGCDAKRAPARRRRRASARAHARCQRRSPISRRSWRKDRARGEECPLANRHKPRRQVFLTPHEMRLLIYVLPAILNLSVNGTCTCALRPLSAEPVHVPGGTAVVVQNAAQPRQAGVAVVRRLETSELYNTSRKARNSEPTVADAPRRANNTLQQWPQKHVLQHHNTPDPRVIRAKSETVGVLPGHTLDPSAASRTAAPT